MASISFLMFISTWSFLRIFCLPGAVLSASWISSTHISILLFFLHPFLSHEPPILSLYSKLLQLYQRFEFFSTDLIPHAYVSPSLSGPNIYLKLYLKTFLRFCLFVKYPNLYSVKEGLLLNMVLQIFSTLCRGRLILTPTLCFLRNRFCQPNEFCSEFPGIHCLLSLTMPQGIFRLYYTTFPNSLNITWILSRFLQNRYLSAPAIFPDLHKLVLYFTIWKWLI